MRLIKVDTGLALAALLRRRRAEFPPDCYEALCRKLSGYLFVEARGVLRTVAVLWRFEAKRTGDRALWRAAKAAFDAAECKQVITAGEDL